jgi:hypothetical protein
MGDDAKPETEGPVTKRPEIEIGKEKFGLKGIEVDGDVDPVLPEPEKHDK